MSELPKTAVRRWDIAHIDDAILFVNDSGPGLGIEYRGQVVVLPVERWHALGVASTVKTADKRWFDAGYLGNGHCSFMLGDFNGPSCHLSHGHTGEHFTPTHTRCTNWPCGLPYQHKGPCSTSDGVVNS